MKTKPYFAILAVAFITTFASCVEPYYARGHRYERHERYHHDRHDGYYGHR